jgi:hypothetical protein
VIWRSSNSHCTNVPGNYVLTLTSRSDLEVVRKKCARNALKLYFGHDPGHGQFSALLHDATNAAADYAAINGIEVETFENGLCSDAIELVDTLSYVFDRSDQLWSDEKNLEASENGERQNIWEHATDPIYQIKTNDTPHISRNELEYASTEYLNFPWRCQALDRLFVDSLVAFEFYAYGVKVMHEKTYGLFPPSSPLKERHVFLDYLVWVIGLAIVNSAVIGGAIWSGIQWTGWPALVVFVISAIIFIWISARLPFSWRNQIRARKNVIELIVDMSHVYTELDSDGLISAKRIYGLLENSAAKGVVWPSPLFAILDDVITRDGRF